MKKIFSFICAICAVCGSFSCSDLLETESSRQIIDPTIGDKTDSVFYAFGILQAMQQLADQYVFQGEMRGDLVKTTYYTDNNLRQLADFSATTANKYDSAYVYYRVINNCNYYIAHCDTNQYNASTNVVMDKYVAAKAIRAWAYLQLGRNYERVPFFTEPLTQISQIDKNYPELALPELVAQLAPDLEQYTGKRVPTLGNPGSPFNIGSPNWESTQKSFNPFNCFIPVDVVLGDMYLEVATTPADYAAAARHYVTFLTQVATAYYPTYSSNYVAPMASKGINTGRFGQQDDELPSNNLVYDGNLPTPPVWSGIFNRNSNSDIITYIPMASSAQNGQTTLVPLTFGFDYYATPEETARSGAPYVDEIQVLPSEAYNLLSDSTEYYYYYKYSTTQSNPDSIRIAKAGDMRLRSVTHQELEGDSVLQWNDKYKYANIVLYRMSTIWLRLAEAFNRMDMPDAAFVILKDGIGEFLLNKDSEGVYDVAYLTDYSRNKLLNEYPLLFRTDLFPNNTACGIHCHGAGRAASDYPGSGAKYYAGKSPYQLDRMAGLKMKEIADVYGVTIGATRQDTINAVEDLICDEYALETAFEGNRFFDLCRMARHKNADSPYGANFGSLWLARKLAYKNPQKDLTNPQNWYLPFK